jgi:hypothetical protein
VTSTRDDVSLPRAGPPEWTAALLMCAVLCSFSVVLFYPAVGTLRSWWTVQPWVATRAELTEEHLEEGSQRSSWSNGNATQQINVVIRAYASYRYSYEGRDYEGHFVSVSDGHEYFQRALAEALFVAHKERQPITVYVEPRDPHRAIYCRDAGAQWAKDLAFGLALSGFGVVLSSVILRRHMLFAWSFTLFSFAFLAATTTYLILDQAWTLAYLDMRALGGSSPVPDPMHPAGIARGCLVCFLLHPIVSVFLGLFDLASAWLLLMMSGTSCGLFPKRK